MSEERTGKPADPAAGRHEHNGKVCSCGARQAWMMPPEDAPPILLDFDDDYPAPPPSAAREGEFTRGYRLGNRDGIEFGREQTREGEALRLLRELVEVYGGNYEPKGRLIDMSAVAEEARAFLASGEREE